MAIETIPGQRSRWNRPAPSRGQVDQGQGRLEFRSPPELRSQEGCNGKAWNKTSFRLRETWTLWSETRLQTQAVCRALLAQMTETARLRRQPHCDQSPSNHTQLQMNEVVKDPAQVTDIPLQCHEFAPRTPRQTARTWPWKLEHEFEPRHGLHLPEPSISRCAPPTHPRPLSPAVTHNAHTTPRSLSFYAFTVPHCPHRPAVTSASHGRDRSTTWTASFEAGWTSSGESTPQLF